MEQRRQIPSYLYTVRLWPEDLGNGQLEWRGCVKYVASGEEHYFRDWSQLHMVMIGMMGSANALAAKAAKNDHPS